VNPNLLKLSAFAVAAMLCGGAAAEDAIEVGRIVVDGDLPGNGLIAPEETPKARSSVTRAAIEQKSSLNNSFQAISLLPGINTYSNDATGLFGGNLRMRGFNSDQVGITVDGAPVNDAGNFAVYPPELVDIENLEEIFITQGSTDNDAPHVGSVGGNIGLVTSNPVDQRRFRAQQTLGSDQARRTYLRADTGYLGDNRFKAFVSYSNSEADKWKGKGKADREHVDLKAILNLAPGSSISGGLLWNRMYNHNLRTLTKDQIDVLGRDADFGTVAPQHLAAGAGAQNEASQYNNINNATAASAGYLYYGLNVNPFENYIATLKGNFQLTPTLRLDVEPYYWYGYGTGGNELRRLSESNAGNRFGGGIRDINGDGDTLDTIMVYSAGVTDTHRPGVTFRLSSQLDNHRVMAGVWYERADHRRTQPAVTFNNAGHISDPWLEHSSKYLLRQDGTAYQGRDFRTVNTAASLFLQDSVGLMNDRLNLTFGLRRMGINRDFTNYASEGGGATYNVEKSYFKTLPSFSARYQLSNERQVFFNATENFRAPPDSVFYGLLKGGAIVGGVLTGYTVKPVNVGAETATNLDLGYRYAGKDLTFSGSIFYVDYKDRIASAYDPVNNENTNYNVGDSTTKGVELESAWRFLSKWSAYGSLTYTRSNIEEDLRIAANSFEATSGKQFPDVPSWMAGASLQYRDGPWSASLSGKYTGKRYSTLVNDESIAGYTLFDFDAGYRLPALGILREPQLRFNIYNLFDRDYLNLNAASGSGFTTRALGAGGSAPSYYVGAPRTFSLMFAADF